MNAVPEKTPHTEKSNPKVLLFFYFILCTIFIFTLSPLLFFSFETFLAVMLFQFKKTTEEKTFIPKKTFEFKFRYILFLLAGVYVLITTFTIKPGFLFFFMIPLGYFLHKSRFTALCILFYFVLKITGEPDVNMQRSFKLALHSVPGKLAGIWFAGLLCTLSTLYGKNSFSCPPTKTLSGYQGVLTKSFCEGNFLEEKVCRHDLGTLHGIASDGKKERFYFSHTGNGYESPLCMYSPKTENSHKIMAYKASAHHLLFFRRKNIIILPLMSKPEVLMVDATSLKIRKTFRLSSSSLMDAMLDEQKNFLYVLAESGKIYKINLNNDKIKDVSFRHYSGANAYAIALNTRTQTLYVTSWLGGTLSVVDAQKLKLLEVKRFLPSLMGVAVNEEDNEIYLTRPFPPAVLVIDGSTLQTKKKLHTDFGTRSVVYISSKKLLAVGNYFGGTVQFFNTQTGTEVFKFYVGPLLRGITYDPFSQNAFSFSGCGVYEFPLGKIYARAPG